MTTTRYITSRSPSNPTDVVAEIAVMTSRGLDTAIAAAARTQPSWEGRALERSRALQAWAQAVEREGESLARLVVREVGKTIREARGEVGRAVAILRYYAQAPFDPVAEVLPSGDGRSEIVVRRRPLGVVAVVSPWNFPLAIPAWKIAPALAYGNTVIFKAASASIAVAERFVSLARPALSDDVLVFAPLPGTRVGALLSDPRVAGVSFTGSSEVGRPIILQGVTHAKPVQAEMGGQNASVVLADADLDSSAATIAEAAMGYAGQKCTATSRVLVERGAARRFVPLLVDHIRAMVMGDPSDEGTDVGPVIDEPSRTAVAAAIAGATSDGGRVLVGGRAPELPGWYHEPTLVELEDPGVPFAQREVFGPAAAVIVVKDADHAVAVANSTAYGLAGAVFGGDAQRAAAVAARLRVGMVRVNAPTTGVDYWAPFGGHGASSHGPREQGRVAREFFTSTQTMTVVSTR